MSNIAPHESQDRRNVAWLVGYHKKNNKPWSVNWKFCSKGHKDDRRSDRQIGSAWRIFSMIGSKIGSAIFLCSGHPYLGNTQTEEQDKGELRIFWPHKGSPDLSSFKTETDLQNTPCVPSCSRDQKYLDPATKE